ncbi:MAG TPA: GGDEF domain-containing protein [Candidatus Binatia bacterium]|nr:GGDEF domain-containing protein [Candidatus Binatia bacterium]
MLAKDLTALAAALARDDLDTALTAILAAGCREADAVDGLALVWDPDRPDPSLAVAIDATGRPLEGTAADELARTVARPDHPTVVAARDGRPNWQRPDPATGLVWVDLPLVVRREGVEHIVGALAWRRRQPELTEEPRAALAALADLAAVAVDRARLASLVAERAEWFERLAHTDPLTGLANARTFGRVLELEIARAGRQGGEVSVVLFDIDGFADLNAAAGRAAGDDVLRAVAAILAESVRFVDTVARLGGDEFAIVAPGSAGTTVAQRIADGVAALPPVAGTSIRVRSGVARFPADGTAGDDLLAAARRRLAAAPSAPTTD